MTVSMVLLLIFLVVSALALFNPTSSRRHLARMRTEENIRKLEEQDLLASSAYRARRAFQVKEFEDEGSHYFIELEGGGVLFLSGQYLYDYEPVEKKKEVVQPRRFPTTEFTIRRHKTKQYVLDIVCQGAVLEPEIVAPTFDPDDFGSNRIPSDGQLIKDKAYDELKAEKLQSK